jgi:hypothetical protein
MLQPQHDKSRPADPVYLLVVEKEGVFHRLCEDGFTE